MEIFRHSRKQLYNAATSVPDPNNPGQVIRQPFLGNIVPPGDLSHAAQLTLQKYYPLPNLNVPSNVFPNYQFTESTQTSNDQAGVRIDHRFGDHDFLFGRFNRTNPTLISPESLPSYQSSLFNDADNAAIGYVHLFGASTILNVHYGFTKTDFEQYDGPAGTSFLQATGFDRLNPERNGVPLGLLISISGGFTGVSQFAIPNGPQRNHDIHADLSIVRGNHTIGVGAMVYHVHSFDDGWGVNTDFAATGTSRTGGFDGTGLGIASFLVGLPDFIYGFLGDTTANMSTNWYGGYVQDKWQISPKLTLTAGLRYDFVAPATFAGNKVSGLDMDTGQFLIPFAFPPAFPAPNVRKTYFDPRYNGFQPRLGVAYRATEKTVLRTAFAMFDDHNNSLVQESQSLRISWPSGYGASAFGLNQGLPTVTLDNLPSASSFDDPLHPSLAFSANPRNKIPYAMEYNFGIERQLAQSLALSVDYVGALGRHLYVNMPANTAVDPGPGSFASRGQPFPAYSANINYSTNIGTSSYNALQAKLEKSLASGLTFLASYTWSKSLDLVSNGEATTVENNYNLRQDWGPSEFDREQLFTLSGMYALPVGTGKTYLATANPFVRGVLGNWTVGGILSFVSGAPFSVLAGGDIANTGSGSGQRAEVVGDANAAFAQSIHEWFNTQAFALPATYTFGNAGRDNMIGPSQTNFDFVTLRDFPLNESLKLQFRGEFFNIFNHPHFGLPDNNVQSPTFGQILTTTGSPRDIQFALKLMF